MIFGIDTATNRLHWVSDEKFSETHGKDDYGWASCDDKNPDVRRAALFHYMVSFAYAIPEDGGPHHVFCEEPLSLKNGKTTRLLGMAAGAIWAGFIAVNPNAYWHWVDVSSWKKNVVGKGNCSKEEAREHILAVVDFDPVRSEDYEQQVDLYDAHCLLIYGQQLIEAGGLE